MEASLGSFFLVEPFLLECRDPINAIEDGAAVKQGGVMIRTGQVADVRLCHNDWLSADRVFESYTDHSAELKPQCLIHLALGFKHLILCLELNIG